jgi:F0F1-type ATP synthase epsilon subunit
METPAMRYHEVLARPSLHEVADLEQQRIKAQKQAAKRQTAAAKRADIQHKMQKLQKQLADLNAKPI